MSQPELVPFNRDELSRLLNQGQRSAINEFCLKKVKYTKRAATLNVLAERLTTLVIDSLLDVVKLNTDQHQQSPLQDVDGDGSGQSQSATDPNFSSHPPHSPHSNQPHSSQPCDLKGISSFPPPPTSTSPPHSPRTSAAANIAESDALRAEVLELESRLDELSKLRSDQMKEMQNLKKSFSDFMNDGPTSIRSVMGEKMRDEMRRELIKVLQQPHSTSLNTAAETGGDDGGTSLTTITSVSETTALISLLQSAGLADKDGHDAFSPQSGKKNRPQSPRLSLSEIPSITSAEGSSRCEIMTGVILRLEAEAEVSEVNGSKMGEEARGKGGNGSIEVEGEVVECEEGECRPDKQRLVERERQQRFEAQGDQFNTSLTSLTSPSSSPTSPSMRDITIGSANNLNLTEVSDLTDLSDVSDDFCCLDGATYSDPAWCVVEGTNACMSMISHLTERCREASEDLNHLNQAALQVSRSQRKDIT